MTTITLTKTVTAEPGTPGNLTAEQETCLQEAWAHILRLCGTPDVNHDARDHSYDFLAHFTDKTPATFQKAFWNSVLCDDPDDVVLRFLRARKWDVVKAVDMLVSAINWREERRVNTEIVAGGEAVALKKSHTPDEEAFMRQYHSGKSYIRGADKNGHPIYIIKVKLHDPNKQPASVMEDYALHNIETLRVMAKSRQDKVCLIFDLSGFGLKNMDFHFIKFLIQILEARYPETLSVVLVHNAPFVFWGIWSVIKHWLDPIIASKIHFTSGNKSLLPFISRDNLQKCYGGDDNWEYKYVEPVPTENDRMLSEEKKTKVMSEREEIIEQFTKTTAEWLALKADSDSAKEILGKERQEMAKELENNYWRLDPYIRSTTYYHRVGALTRQGDVDFKAAR